MPPEESRGIRVPESERRRASPEDLTAWGLVNRAWVTMQSDLGDAERAEAAIRACEEALALDSEYAFGHAVLAHARSLLVHQPTPHHAQESYIFHAIAEHCRAVSHPAHSIRMTCSDSAHDYGDYYRCHDDRDRDHVLRFETVS